MSHFSRWIMAAAVCLVATGCRPAFDPDSGPRVVVAFRAADESTPEELREFASIVPVLENRLRAFRTPFVVRLTGAKEVEIVFRGDAELRDIADAKHMITARGKLSFLVVANRQDHEPLIGLAEATLGPGRDVKGKNGKALGTWATVPEDRRQEVLAPGDTTRKNTAGEIEILLARDEFEVRGENLTNVKRMLDQTGDDAIDFSVNEAGAERMAMLTGANLPDPVTQLRRRLAIVFDDKVISAPSIQGQISERGQITGNFTREEVDFLVQVLNSGVLPVPLNPVPVRENMFPQ